MGRLGLRGPAREPRCRAVSVLAGVDHAIGRVTRELGRAMATSREGAFGCAGLGSSGARHGRGQFADTLPARVASADRKHYLRTIPRGSRGRCVQPYQQTQPMPSDVQQPVGYQAAWPYAPVPPAMPKSDLARRFHGRLISGAVLLIVGMVLVLICGSLTWWGFNGSAQGQTFRVEAGLSQVCTSLPQQRACTGYTGAERDVFGATGTLLTVGWVLVLLAAIFVFLGALWPRLGSLVAVFGLIGSFLVLAAPLYLFVSLPGVLQAEGATGFVTGFFGSGTIATASYTYGGGIGWFFSFIVFGFLLIATTVAFRAVRTNLPSGNVRFGPAPAYPMATYAQPGYGYAPQQPMAAQPPASPYATAAPGTAPYFVAPPPPPMTVPAAPVMSPSPPMTEGWVSQVQSRIVQLESALNEQKSFLLDLDRGLVEGRIENPVYEDLKRTRVERIAELERELGENRRRLGSPGLAR